MKKTMLVLMSLLLLAGTLKTKNPLRNKSDSKTEKIDSSQLRTTYNESEYEEHDVNIGPVDTARYIFNVVDQMAQFPGGDETVLKFIDKNLKYPISEGEVHGKVVCRFIINRDGSVSDIKVVRSIEPCYDEEAIRVLKLLPKFIPAKQNGRNVRVWYSLPIAFKAK